MAIVRMLRPLMLLAALAGLARPAASAPVPDSVALARLQAAVDSAGRVRVVGPRATYALFKPRLDAFGVTLSHPDDPPALVTLGGARPPEKRISWAEIERLQTERPTPGRGAATGFLIGAAAGGVIVVLAHGRFDDKTEEGSLALYAAVLTVTLTASLGLLLGLGSTSVHPLYP